MEIDARANEEIAKLRAEQNILLNQMSQDIQRLIVRLAVHEANGGKR